MDEEKIGAGKERARVFAYRKGCHRKSMSQTTW
jgi:hypothetical protein